MMIADYASYAMAAALIAAFLIEIRTGRIPNWLTVLPVLVFVAMLIMTDDRGALIWQIGFAASIFIAGLVLFAIGGMGAGAVKLSAVLALFLPINTAIYTFIVFMVAFFISAYLIVKIRKWFGSENSDWHVMANAVIPLSLPIGIAGIYGMFFV